MLKMSDRRTKTIQKKLCFVATVSVKQMIRNTVLWPVSFCLCALAVAVELAEVPPIPKGYADDQAVKTAILLGQIKLIDAMNVSIPHNVEEILGIEYGTGGERKLHLDLYQPKGRTKATPAIFFIHGGAWRSGKRSDMKFYCVKFAEKGYVTATASYRLTGEAPFPAAVHDVKCAVRWLRASAAKYQVDPKRIAVSGNSAGGHLSMMIGYSDDPALEGTGGNNGVSSGVCAVVNFYGPTDLTTDFAKKQGVVEDFMGGKTFDEAPDIYRLASPLFHLTRDDPPTLIFHGTIDSTVPIVQADKLSDKLKELGIDYIYERYDGWPHVMDLAEAVNRRCIYQMEQFFKKYLSID
jgi:acetyl esterase/lipase